MSDTDVLAIIFQIIGYLSFSCKNVQNCSSAGGTIFELSLNFRQSRIKNIEINCVRAQKKFPNVYSLTHNKSIK